MIELKELQPIINIYNNKIKTLNASQIGISMVFKIASIICEFEKSQQIFEERIQAIMEEYCQKDENGNFIMSEDGLSSPFIEGKSQEANLKLEELNHFQIDINSSLLTQEEVASLAPYLTLEDIVSMMPIIKN